MKANPTRICVPVCVRHSNEIPAAMKRAAQAADMIELRLDYLEENELDSIARLSPEHLNQFGVPVILTLRSEDQGGRASAGCQARQRFWASLEKIPENCLIDLELDLAQQLAMEKPDSGMSIDWSAVICSHHDFAGVPANLEMIYERMAATPARILKIAVQADDATDCLPIFRLLDRAQNEGRELIAIAMGQAGIATRILGPSRGSYLTYGSLDDESATAPGQLTARELREVYRIDLIDRQTEVFGIIGKPVGHSLSPRIHNAAFGASRVNAVYIPFEVSDVNQFMRRMAHPRTRELDWNLCGLSVTAPHKASVMTWLDWIDPAAKEIGAVNTIVVRGNELHGYNADAPGFISPLRKSFGSLKDARCAIIGAGGGARAALWALRNEAAQVELFVRDLVRAKPAAERFGVDYRVLANASFEGFDIVINATPLGTRGLQQDETPAVAEQLRNVRLTYDLVYNPLETRFLREARAAGCETLSGIEMLLAQAAEQFKLWTGREPEVELVRAAAIQASMK
ncbi:MAG TPA: shikimate dehydrogenase [Pyrinomonadaceae bacterium]|nr:shikimate dehydrogenase [Pyrinomonadaceae bacterium]